MVPVYTFARVQNSLLSASLDFENREKIRILRMTVLGSAILVVKYAVVQILACTITPT